jgi:hypothetical protein
MKRLTRLRPAFDVAFLCVLWVLAAVRGFDAFALVVAAGWTARVVVVEPLWRRRSDR